MDEKKIERADREEVERLQTKYPKMPFDMRKMVEQEVKKNDLWDIVEEVKDVETPVTKKESEERKAKFFSAMSTKQTPTLSLGFAILFVAFVLFMFVEPFILGGVEYIITLLFE